jgi:hypothetical protein
LRRRHQKKKAARAMPIIPRATPIPIPAAAPDDIPELDEPELDESGEEVEVEEAVVLADAEAADDPDSVVVVDPDWLEDEVEDVGSCLRYVVNKVR